jgi:hypothetical protein
MREQLRLAFNDFRKLVFKHFGDTVVEGAARFAQQRAIGRVLHQSMLEQISRMWRDALPEQQAGLNKPVQRRFQFRFRFAHHGRQQGV